MRIPLSWLAEITETTTPLTPEQVHAALVKVGFEEEDTHDFAVSGPIVVGEVLEKNPETHSNGKTINWCQVRVAAAGKTATDGGADVRGIICGAHNFQVGDKVIACLPGAVLPGDFQIASRKTYGHVSEGMLASTRELGLGDDHDGIIVLSDLGLDAPVGSCGLTLLGMTDSAVEINVTTDRGYALSLRGVGREYAASCGKPFTDPVPALADKAAQQQISGYSATLTDNAPIRGNQGVNSFVVRTISGVRANTPTPRWMVTRLLLAGQRPLGIITDITNYVMLELGNPLHAYDATKLNGALGVRRATPQEKLTTLDGVARELDAEDLVIADSAGAVALAGVMGSEHTKVDENTTTVVIEAAQFDPVTVARTQRRHKLHSEAAKRFARFVDPQLAQAAAQRAVDLLVELAGATAEQTGFVKLAAANNTPVHLPAQLCKQLIGYDYTPEQILHALTVIGCQVQQEAAGYQVTAPSWRVDLQRPADLVEEVARIVGYDKIPSLLPQAQPGRGLTRKQRLLRRIADTVTAQGLTEVQNYPFSTEAQISSFDGAPLTAALAGSARAEAVKLANALDAKASWLRKSLLPGLLTCASRNSSRGLTDLALVEIGSVWFAPQGINQLGTDSSAPIATALSSAQLEQLAAALPAQPTHIAALFTGAQTQAGPFSARVEHDWRSALNAAEQIAWACGARLEIKQATHPAFHPGRTAALYIGTELLGYAGQLLPQLVKAHHLPYTVSALELDIDRLLELAPRTASVKGLSTYPAATQDVTLLVGVDTPSATVAEAFQAGAGQLLEAIYLTADYRGQNLPPEQKALTYALRFRSAAKTLTAEEATAAKLAGVAAAEASCGAKIRE